MFKNQFDSKLYFYDQFDIKLQRLRINLSLKYYSHDQFLALFVYLITKFKFGSFCTTEINMSQSHVYKN